MRTATDIRQCLFVELKENQILFEHVPIELRWHNGSPEKRCSGGPWFPWVLGLFGDLNDSGDAWFRKHCPIDKYITDDGKLVSFRMRDDGEAETVQKIDGYTWQTRPGRCLSEHPWVHALYRFRDAERARWTFEATLEHVQVCEDGRDRGYHYKHGWSGLVAPTVPSWVRHKAEALWRENHPHWRTWWSAPFQMVVGTTWIRSDVRPFPSESPRLKRDREKLRAWTEAQLAKRKPAEELKQTWKNEDEWESAQELSVSVARYYPECDSHRQVTQIRVDTEGDQLHFTSSTAREIAAHLVQCADTAEREDS